MAGSRVHKYKSILKRVEGLIKAEALPWKERPLWYDVMQKFPPKVPPDFERPVPTETVQKILYPEDLIRAKYYEEFVDRDVVNLRVEQTYIKTKSQIFVDEYLRQHESGKSFDETIEQIEHGLSSELKKYVRRKEAKTFVEPEPEFDIVEAAKDIKTKHTAPDDWYKSKSRE